MGRRGGAKTKADAEFDRGFDGRSNALGMTKRSTNRNPVQRPRIFGGGAGAGAWQRRRRRTERPAAATAPPEPNRRAVSVAEVSLSDFLISEVSLEPVFELAKTTEDMQANDGIKGLRSSSVISVPRLVLPSLPEMTDLLEPEPSIPGTAWVACLKDEFLPRFSGQVQVTMVMPGEWVGVGDANNLLGSQTGDDDEWFSDVQLEPASIEEKLPQLADSTEGLDEPTGPTEPRERAEALDAIAAREVEEAAQATDLSLADESTRQATPAPGLKVKRRAKPSVGGDSPTLRAVLSTLRKPSGSVETLASPPAAARVYLQLEDQTTLLEEVERNVEAGVDSVWLEVGDPALVDLLEVDLANVEHERIEAELLFALRQ